MNTTSPIYNADLLQPLVTQYGTPLWLIDAKVLRQRIADIKFITSGEGVQARYAMKANPTTRVLEEMHSHGIWIDTVSGNEVLRALHAGVPAGNDPAEIILTCDVFRDNALDVIKEHNILPNIGSPGMLQNLADEGYTGPVALRINPGFGHGHVNECDTGGPSSKHGIWHEGIDQIADHAKSLGMTVVMIHSHIGSGPQFGELLENLQRLAREFAEILPDFPEVRSISLGGGIPHDYRNPDYQADLEALRDVLDTARERFCEVAGRDILLEIEPGRYFVAPASTLVTKVHDIKSTETNAKGTGSKFVMVDAGFVDLVRPAMYGSYHRIELVGKEGSTEQEDVVIAGPMCESGDVFTRDGSDMLVPRTLPVAEIGDLMLIRDGGAYGYSMSSNYNSIGRAPQLWLEEDGSVQQLTRRENFDDLLDLETR